MQSITRHAFFSSGSGGRGAFALSLIAAALVSLPGCHLDMYDQKKYEPYEFNTFFADSLAMRPLVEGTVVHKDRADAQEDSLLSPRTHATAFPFPLTRAILARGRERFEIFCSPCHGRTGDGAGMIVQRGFPAPPSFHTDSLRARPAGHFVDVMTKGFGRMYSYASRVGLRDRWAVAAYIRALQLSRDFPASELSAAERRQMEGGK